MPQTRPHADMFRLSSCEVDIDARMRALNIACCTAYHINLNGKCMNVDISPATVLGVVCAEHTNTCVWVQWVRDGSVFEDRVPQPLQPQARRDDLAKDYRYMCTSGGLCDGNELRMT